MYTVTLPVFKFDLPSSKRLNGLRLNAKEKNFTMLNSTVEFRTFQKESCPEFFTKFSQVTSQLSILEINVTL